MQEQSNPKCEEVGKKSGKLGKQSRGKAQKGKDRKRERVDLMLCKSGIRALRIERERERESTKYIFNIDNWSHKTVFTWLCTRLNVLYNEVKAIHPPHVCTICRLPYKLV